MSNRCMVIMSYDTAYIVGGPKMPRFESTLVILLVRSNVYKEQFVHRLGSIAQSHR